MNVGLCVCVRAWCEWLCVCCEWLIVFVRAWPTYMGHLTSLRVKVHLASLASLASQWPPLRAPA